MTSPAASVPNTASNIATVMFFIPLSVCDPKEPIKAIPPDILPELNRINIVDKLAPGSRYGIAKWKNAALQTDSDELLRFPQAPRRRPRTDPVHRYAGQHGWNILAKQEIR